MSLPHHRDINQQGKEKNTIWFEKSGLKRTTVLYTSGSGQEKVALVVEKRKEKKKRSMRASPQLPPL